MTALFILAMYLGQASGTLDESASRMLVQELLRLPGKLETVLSNDAIYEALARTLSAPRDFLFLGRGIHFPIALEGALKLKEISLHSRGRVSGRRNEARAERADRREPAGGGAGHARSRESRREPAPLREDALEYPGSQGAQGIVVAVAARATRK